MNLPFSYQKKLKIAMFLFLIMAFTLLIRILEDRSIKNISVAFTSIYNDRLVPATDLFQVLLLINQKEHQFNAYFNNQHSTLNLGLLTEKNATIDLLLNKYEETYLTHLEKISLSALKEKLNEHKQLEAAIGAENSAKVLTNQSLYRLKLSQSVQEIAQKLTALVQIQSNVGHELVKDSELNITRSNFYAAAQLVLAILIGILIVSILFTANVVNMRNEKFNLN
jgi:hypothetical protein